MTDQECIHEIDWVKVIDKKDALLAGQGDVKATLNNLDTTIRGNGKQGLKTQVALNKQAIKRMWNVVGGVFLAFMGLAIKSLVFA